MYHSTTLVFPHTRGHHTLISVYRHDLTSNNLMDFPFDNCCTTPTIKSYLATVLSGPESVVHCVNVDVAAKSSLIEMALLEPAVRTSKETIPSFLKGVMAKHTFGKSKKAAITVVESDFAVTDIKLEPLQIFWVDLQCRGRGDIERALADLSVLWRTNIEVIVYSPCQN